MCEFSAGELAHKFIKLVTSLDTNTPKKLYPFENSVQKIYTIVYDYRMHKCFWLWTRLSLTVLVQHNVRPFIRSCHKTKWPCTNPIALYMHLDVLFCFQFCKGTFSIRFPCIPVQLNRGCSVLQLISEHQLSLTISHARVQAYGLCMVTVIPPKIRQLEFSEDTF